MAAIKTTIKVPLQHACFAGHFPGNPIVPGALLMQWVFQLLREQLPGHEVKGVKSIKFTASLKPGDSCDLEFQHEAATGKVRLSCQSEAGVICKAVVLVSLPVEVG